MSFLVKLKSIAAYLCLGHGQSRRELSEQSMYAVCRNVPYTEETEHVVDAVSVEILSHIAESAHPPLASVSKHTVPVVRRESPVLSVGSESIWWRTCLSVKVEVVRFEPHVASCTVDTDRYVTLENYAASHSVFVCDTHLLVEHKLHIVEEGKLLVCLSARIRQLSTFGFSPFTMTGPGIEVGCAISVAQIAVLCVWHEPALVVAEELLERS